MEEMIEDVNRFSKIIGDKGYDGHFLTNGGYPDRLKDSVLRYLYSSIIGDEKGIGGGLHLFTYLEWKGDDKPFIDCSLTVRHSPVFGLQVSDMEISYKNEYGFVLKSKRFEGIIFNDIPERHDAVNMVKERRERLGRGIKL